MVYALVHNGWESAKKTNLQKENAKEKTKRDREIENKKKRNNTHSKLCRKGWTETGMRRNELENVKQNQQSNKNKR